VSDKPFQRIGSISNAHVGKDFETAARDWFLKEGFELTPNFVIDLGVGNLKKPHSFDIGSANPAILVECKSHRWTIGDVVPSAKLAVWNEAMYFFHLAPQHFRKVLFVLKHTSSRRNISLASYYIKTFRHLIPRGVEFLEYEEDTGGCALLV
jgi:hypothetical protein